MYNIKNTSCYNRFYLSSLSKISSPKNKKTLNLTFEKIKWSVYNINEISFVALSGIEPEQTESQVLARYHYAIRLIIKQLRHFVKVKLDIYHSQDLFISCTF